MAIEVVTMTDIMEDFRRGRFMVAPSYISRGLAQPQYGHMIVLTDIGFWADNIDALVQWCQDHGCETRGMTVDIPDDQTLTLFCLRWK